MSLNKLNLKLLLMGNEYLNKWLIVSLLTITAFFGHSQLNAQSNFQKSFGGSNEDEGKSVQQTTDGGYIIAGVTHSFGAGDEDIYLIKTDANGDTLWTRAYGGTHDDEAHSVQQTTDGAYIIVGETKSFGSGKEDVYLIKVDSSGTLLWSKTYGGNEDDEGHFIRQTTDGGYIITGETHSFGAGEKDVYIIKTDSVGHITWTKAIGGNHEDEGNCVRQTTDGGYIVVGETHSFGAGKEDVYLIKLDSNGNIQWTKAYGGSDDDDGHSVWQTTDGGYIITGETHSFGAGKEDVYLIKVNSSGALQWSKAYGGADEDEGNAVQQTTDGGYIIGGESESFGNNEELAYVIKTNSIGDTLWTATFAAADETEFHDIQQTSDGGYIATGEIETEQPGEENVFLVKFDSTGSRFACNTHGTATTAIASSTSVGGGGSASSGGTKHGAATVSSGTTTLDTVLCYYCQLSIDSSTVTDVSCFGGSNGAINISISGSNGTVTYQWTGPNGFTDSTQNIANLSAGNYQLTVTDANNCFDNMSFTVNQPGAALSITGTVTNVDCYGSSSGAIDITVSGGTAPYTYSWSNGTTTEDLTGLAAGTYTVTVSDAHGCTATHSFTVNQPSAALSVTGTVTNVDCYGNLTGAIDITVSGGTAPYTYSWSNGSTTEDLTGLAAGTYTVTVTDAHGCTATHSFTVNQPGAALSITGTVTNVDCYGSSSGAIDITVSGGTAPYTYAWSNGTTTEDLTGLAAGTYTVTVSDAHGCTATHSFTVNQPSAALSITGTVTNVDCYGSSSGAIDITVSGGTAPYTYSWSNGASTEDLTGLAAGTYTVTVTDANGCTATHSFTVNQPGAALSITGTVTNVDCYGSSSGAIDITVSGGTAPYTYSWSNGASTEDLTGLSAGTYTVTVSDAHGCTSTHSFTVNQPSAALALSGIVTNLDCYGNTSGAIDITVSGGTAPYTYSWSNGTSTEDLTGLAAGTYTVTVSDANGCTSTHSFTVTQPAQIVITVDSIIGQSCNGISDGAIYISISGGFTPYTYNWTGPNGFTASTQDIDSLAPGTYYLTVTDVHNCTSSDSMLVPGVNPLSINLNGPIQNVSCNGNADAYIHIGVSGGTSPYSYSWSGPNGFTANTQNISNLGPGTYTVQVTDAHACFAIDSFTITEPSLLSLTSMVTNVACYAGTDGAIDITITGGTPPYTFLWSNGATTEDLSGLSAGVYTVLVTDANGCTISSYFVVGSDSHLTSQYAAIDPHCGEDNGSIDLTVLGGSGSYFYAWNNGETTEDIDSLAAGTFMVTITDSVYGCTAIDTVILQNISAPQLSAILTNTNCSGNIGTIDLSVSGGAGPFTYSWSNGATSQDISGLAAGTYIVTVNDSTTGCIAIGNYNIQQTSTLLISAVITPANCGYNDGSITVTIANGSGNYSYSWSNSDTAATISNLLPGSYSVTVTDNVSGCEVLGTFIVNGSNAPSLVLAITDVNCAGGSDGSIDLSVSGGTGPYTYLWSNGEITQDLSGLIAGSYTVTVTDMSTGCISIGHATITQGAPLDIIADRFNVSCSGSGDGALNITVMGGTPPYTYLWSNGATTQNISNLSPGTYSVTVTDSTACSNTLSTTISQPDTLNISLESIIPSGCYGNPNGAIDIAVFGGTTPYTYLWSTGDTTQDLTGLWSGIYSITVTDANGCIDTMMIELNSNANLQLNALITNILCDGGNTGAIDLSVSGGSGMYNYQWSNGEITQDLSALSAGLYLVTVTDSVNGCQAYGAYSVVDSSFAVSSVIINPSCGIANGEIHLYLNGGSGQFSFNWSNGGPDTSSQTGLFAGIYGVTISDTITNCSTALNFNIENVGAPEISGIVVDATACAATDGSIDITVSGGSGSYSYLWSNNITTQDISNLGAGVYTVSVTDDTSGCQSLATFHVGEDNSMGLSAQVINANCSQADGEIWLGISGGSGSYSYLWSTGATTKNLLGLTAGTYIVTVTDLGSTCSDTLTVTLSSNGGPVLSANVTQVGCAGSGDGSIDVIVTPAGNYQYNWSSGDTTEDLYNLVPGLYVLTVTDTATGCFATASWTITEPAPINMVVNKGEVNCNGDDGGWINLTVTGGMSGYSYNWSGPNGFSATTQNISNLFAGDYNITVTDTSGCAVSATINISEPDAILISIDSTLESSCDGSTDGAMYISVSGGAAPYMYSLNGTPAQNNGIFTGLASGIYNVIVSDANGCSDSMNVNIQHGPGISVIGSITNVTCSGGSDGAVDLTVSGGSGHYTYIWSNGESGQDLNNVVADLYVVTIIDSVSGCYTTGAFTVSDTSIVVNMTVVDAIACDSTNGSIDITVLGGSGNYSYNWNTGSTTEDLSGLPAGTYLITITDLITGCSTTASTVVNSLGGPQLSGIIYNATCTSINGSIDLSVTGGQSPYNFVWSNGALTEDISNLAPGDYFVTVSDNNGCNAVAKFSVSEENSLEVSAQVSDANCGNRDGSIDITVSGGSGIYTYNWSNGATTEDIAGLLSGTYLVQINDQYTGCSITSVYNVSNNAGPSLTANVNDAVCPGAHDGSIDLTINGGSGFYTVEWSNGETTEDISGLTSGIYVVLVLDEQTGCSSSASFTVAETDPFLVVAQVGCDNNPYIDIEVSGANGNYSFNWSNGETSQNINNLTTGLYTVTITDNKGCNIVSNIDVSVDCNEEPCDPATIIIPDVITPNNDGFNDVWVISNDCGFENEIWIFNRWGDQVYHATPYMNEWHGKYLDTDKDLPDGTYYYIYSITQYDSSGNRSKNLDFKGFIVIQR